MINNEDPKVLARKIIKSEDIIKRSGEYQKKLEDEIFALRKQLRGKLEQEEIMKQEISKTKKNYNSLKTSYQKLNDDYLTIVDILNDKKARKKEISKTLRSVEAKLSDEIVSRSNFYLENIVETLNAENNKLKKTLEEIDWVNEQNYKNLQLMKDELQEQVKIAKASEICMRKSFTKLQTDFLEKEKVLKNYDEKFRLAEDSLKLFYITLKYKEDQINLEKL